MYRVTQTPSQAKRQIYRQTNSSNLDLTVLLGAEWCEGMVLDRDGQNRTEPLNPFFSSALKVL